MKNFGKIVQENSLWIAFVFVMIGAIFMRTYQFDEWLYFKMDQSRDSLLMTKAIENGPGYLPLLGARAGATKLEHGFLRLGPAFYYFQYIAAKIFDSNQPYVAAYPDLFFGVLAIPMVFLLARLYFSRRNALFVSAMYAFSFIIIQYSRFSWNPNSLQFFLLASFYGLLRMLNEGNEKRRRWWIALWAFSAAVGSQLHFFGFFTLIGASGLLMFWHFKFWEKENIKKCMHGGVIRKIVTYAGIVAVIFTVLYAPVIISDVFKKGENTHNFFEAMGSKPSKNPLGQKISKAVTESGKYYCLITTSQCYGSSMRKEIPALLLTFAVVISGLVLILGKLKQKLEPLKMDFLVLLLIWSGTFFILTIPVSYQLRPRFFIVVFAIPFLFLGLVYEYLEEKLDKKKAIMIAMLVTAGVIAWNTYGTVQWFKEQAKSQNEAVTVKRTLILKAKDGVTLGQLQRVSDWIYARHDAEKNLYYYVKPEHVRPINFLLKNKKDGKLNFAAFKKINNDPDAEFFAILPADDDIDSIKDKFSSDVLVLASEQVGQIKVYQITFPSRTTSASFRWKKAGDGEDRIYWKDVFAALGFGMKK